MNVKSTYHKRMIPCFQGRLNVLITFSCDDSVHSPGSVLLQNHFRYGMFGGVGN